MVPKILLKTASAYYVGKKLNQDKLFVRLVSSDLVIPIFINLFFSDLSTKKNYYIAQHDQRPA